MFYKRIILHRLQGGKTAGGLFTRQVQTNEGRSTGGLDSNGDVEVVMRAELWIHSEGGVRRIG